MARPCIPPGTSGDQLDDWARGRNRHEVRIPGWLEVYASDELPDLALAADRAGLSRAPPQTGFCLISNMSPARDNGSHWTAFSHLRAPGQAARYFDSYGAPPDGDDAILHVRTAFRDFLRKNSTTGTYNWNRFDLQASRDVTNPDTCGEWSLFFLSTGGVLPVRSGRGRALRQPWGAFQVAAVNGHNVSADLLRVWGQDGKDELVGKKNDRTVRRTIGILPVDTPACN